YVRPLAVTFAMPFNSILTMARLELRQLPIEIVFRARILRRRFTGLNLDLALWIDPHAGDRETRREHGLERAGDIALAEAGRRARHHAAPRSLSYQASSHRR